MTATARRAAPHVDQVRALRVAAANLAREFDGSCDIDTVERLLITCYDEIAERAVVVNHLPVLAERAARRRLRRLVTSECDVAGLDAPRGAAGWRVAHTAERPRRGARHIARLIRDLSR